MSEEIAKYDKAMGFRNETVDGTDWYSVDSPNVELNGLYWRKPGEGFRRIPFDSKISEGVDWLAWNTAGVMLRFKTNSPEIKVNVKVGHTNRMDHMAHVGIMGFDLYVGSGSAKSYAGSSRFDHHKDEYNVIVNRKFSEEKLREFTLHFPLYWVLKKVLLWSCLNRGKIPVRSWSMVLLFSRVAVLPVRECVIPIK